MAWVIRQQQALELGHCVSVNTVVINHHHQSKPRGGHHFGDGGELQLPREAREGQQHAMMGAGSGTSS